jgi:hypothetical protein
VIDCDIHNQVGDIEQFLQYVSPASPQVRDGRVLVEA